MHTHTHIYACTYECHGNHKPITDTQKNKEKEYKPSTKESHQVTMGETKRS